MAFGPVSIGGSSYVLPPATADTLGGVVIGDNLTVDEQGKVNLSVATATTLGGVKLSGDFTADADGTLHLAGGTAPDPFPVGSIYQSTDPTSPAALFGGSWEEIASERVLMGASSAHAAGTTVEAGLPNITGTLSEIMGTFWASPSGSGAFSGKYIGRSLENGSSGNYGNIFFDASKSNAIYGRSSTVQPAAYYVHIWHRVA